VAESRDHGFAYYEAQGRIQLGWTLAMADGDEAGCAQILEGSARLERTGTVLGLLAALVQLAEAYVRVGRTREAREVLDGARDPARGGGTRCWNAELARLRGELAHEAGARDEAFDCYEEALATARGQGARSLELRAASSYAKMLAAEGRREHARRLLEGVVASFTEGDDTVELRAARAWLAGTPDVTP